ncbi:MAG: hypothetical protein HYR56_02840 [Acidobacteria bacterium]|nr:hypothetical protein [Acidobacteriota bacterium]MBI3425607.1 hypothetical protein [Acidobacteriota bacterium]
MKPIRSICLTLVAAVLLSGALAAQSANRVTLLHAPGSGVQPQALPDERGTLHLIYLTGEPGASDVLYVKRAVGQTEFSAPLRVNSQPGSAVATGTIRGAQLALGKRGRVHVVWNGSQKTASQGTFEAPLLYARLNDAGTAFEPQRNLMQQSHALDGGGTIAADGAGNVYVAWHGAGAQKGEEYRRVWLARSTDDGQSFARETAVDPDQTGACACCGMRAFADQAGAVYLLYRTATKMTERGMYMLVSQDRGQRFRGQRLDDWTLTTCPMSSVTMTNAAQPLAAWENNGQVQFAALDAKLAQRPTSVAAPATTGKRKHPAITVNARGETLLVWTEGTGWKRGGSLAWQLYDRAGNPAAERGSAEGVPVWGLATAVALPNGEFQIIY